MLCNHLYTLKSRSTRYCRIVRSLSVKNGPNSYFPDKSAKFGIDVENNMENNSIPWSKKFDEWIS